VAGEVDELLEDSPVEVAGCCRVLKQDPQLTERDLTRRQAMTYVTPVERQRCRTVGQQAKTGLQGVERQKGGSAHGSSGSFVLETRSSLTEQRLTRALPIPSRGPDQEGSRSARHLTATLLVDYLLNGVGSGHLTVDGAEMPNNGWEQNPALTPWWHLSTVLRVH
jgi:hypothetical protein